MFETNHKLKNDSPNSKFLISLASILLLFPISILFSLPLLLFLPSQFPDPTINVFEKRLSLLFTPSYSPSLHPSVFFFLFFFSFLLSFFFYVSFLTARSISTQKIAAKRNCAPTPKISSTKKTPDQFAGKHGKMKIWKFGKCTIHPTNPT